jgi:hypothetical protein
MQPKLKIFIEDSEGNVVKMEAISIMASVVKSYEEDDKSIMVESAHIVIGDADKHIARATVNSAHTGIVSLLRSGGLDDKTIVRACSHALANAFVEMKEKSPEGESKKTFWDKLKRILWP